MLLVGRHTYLLFGNLRSSSRKPGKVQRAMLLQGLQSFGRGNQLFDVKTPIGIEVDAVKTAVRGANLILRTNTFLDHFLLDMNGVSREIMFTAHLIFERIQ